MSSKTQRENKKRLEAIRLAYTPPKPEPPKAPNETKPPR